MNINIDVFVVTVCFGIAQITGDKLGLNGICGFVECFVSNHFCRNCRMHIMEMRRALTAKLDLLRKFEDYNDDLEQNDPTSTGQVTNQVTSHFHTELQIPLILLIPELQIPGFIPSMPSLPLREPESSELQIPELQIPLIPELQIPGFIPPMPSLPLPESENSELQIPLIPELQISGIYTTDALTPVARTRKFRASNTRASNTVNT
jgi:hypothetical protein